jgi:hypothetical protein
VKAPKQPILIQTQRIRGEKPMREVAEQQTFISMCKKYGAYEMEREKWFIFKLTYR